MNDVFYYVVQYKHIVYFFSKNYTNTHNVIFRIIIIEFSNQSVFYELFVVKTIIDWFFFFFIL